MCIRDSGITGLGDEAITISGTATVEQANALDDLTTGTITATITDGDITTLKTLTNDASLANGHAYTITVTDTTASAADLTSVNALTSVNIVTTNVTNLTGSLDELKTLYASL